MRDVDAQAGWLDRHGRRADLQRLRRQVRDRLRQLAEYPELGHDEDGDGLRELSLYPLPFIVLYELEEAVPQVVRVVGLFHERQDQDLSG
jgi:plasmid stabilization system protein ParE